MVDSLIVQQCSRPDYFCSTSKHTPEHWILRFGARVRGAQLIEQVGDIRIWGCMDDFGTWFPAKHEALPWYQFINTKDTDD